MKKIYAQEQVASPVESKQQQNSGVTVPMRYARGDGTGYDAIEWENRSVEITSPQTGESVFKADSVTVPYNWSQNCATLVAEKYFRVVNGKRETSVKQMIDRVVHTISDWGSTFGYWKNSEQKTLFEIELKHILVHQKAAFNSPVWFNVGTNNGELDTEQCSACFLLAVEDNMDSILNLAVEEGWVYKGGSGSGVNYSPLRSSKEPLTGGGFSSGPVSFMRKDDANGGSIKSGGTTRRAAKMNILDIDHGDILEFIQCKAKAEQAAQILASSGVVSADFRDPYGAYGLVPFQNANHSVGVTDAFMRAVDQDADWNLLARDGSVLETIKARDLWTAICESAWFCGDPGIQFQDTMNRWHTSPAESSIRTSNPCSEFVYIDHTSCNLASINLCNVNGWAEMSHVVDIMITAMDILVSGGGFPTPKIAEMSRKYRPLGLGFTNLGAYLMRKGLPYDSDEARETAASIMALISGRGYRRSAELARDLGPFEAFDMNRGAMLGVINKHSVAAQKLAPGNALRGAVVSDWRDAYEMGSQFGYRNGQISVLAPAGTISFLMDCDTTGIEPDLSLIKRKKLVGGGTVSIQNQSVDEALRNLGYDESVRATVSSRITDTGGSVVGAAGLDPKHYAVFDCAFPEPVDGRCISPEGHIKMMGAVQPFISGAISKTCNVPSHYTPEQIGDLYMLAWEEGLKAVAVYRDGCKASQPLSSEDKSEASTDLPAPLGRKRLPPTRQSITHKMEISGWEAYLTVGYYDNGKPGEVFVRAGDVGSPMQGLWDTIATLTSFALQYGVPVEDLIKKFSYTTFAPNGITSNPDIRIAHSPVDYIFRFIETLLDPEKPQEVVENTQKEASGHLCDRCGNELQRAGACMTCSTCGWTSGCG